MRPVLSMHACITKLAVPNHRNPRGLKRLALAFLGPSLFRQMEKIQRELLIWIWGALAFLLLLLAPSDGSVTTTSAHNYMKVLPPNRKKKNKVDCSSSSISDVETQQYRDNVWNSKFACVTFVLPCLARSRASSTTSAASSVRARSSVSGPSRTASLPSLGCSLGSVLRLPFQRQTLVGGHLWSQEEWEEVWAYYIASSLFIGSIVIKTTLVFQCSRMWSKHESWSKQLVFQWFVFPKSAPLGSTHEVYSTWFHTRIKATGAQEAPTKEAPTKATGAQEAPTEDQIQEVPKTLRTKMIDFASNIRPRKSSFEESHIESQASKNRTSNIRRPIFSKEHRNGINTLSIKPTYCVRMPKSKWRSPPFIEHPPTKLSR